MFLQLEQNHVKFLLTATMEIQEPKVTHKLQKQQNLGKFLIFDVFVLL
jgi:hypothetical protein